VSEEHPDDQQPDDENLEETQGPDLDSTHDLSDHVDSGSSDSEHSEDAQHSDDAEQTVGSTEETVAWDAEDSREVEGADANRTTPNLDETVGNDTLFSEDVGEKTVLNETVDGETVGNETVVDEGRPGPPLESAGEDLQATLQSLGEETRSSSSERTRRKSSVMQSRDLSQTINPRQLSEKDAAFWGSAAIGASDVNRDEPSRLRPAIERSISETKLQIRERDLAVPTRDPNQPSDYRLVRLLGRGGMGNVYVARQQSLDRMIAVKVIKPIPKEKRQQLAKTGRLAEVEHDRRQQFLSEAVVTGDLDHPNIVPIHDIAVAADNTLFYAMKRVVGKPWSKSIKEKSRDENLEILLKVCDAIAFAHTRGVVHRDIKPENIMLGDFGEVLVMDWGLALAQPEFEKKESISGQAGLGGSPAFMAPEMATGPVESIGPHSDIYLLGATLYYIVAGCPPHKAENVRQCIRAVTRNEIQSVPPEHQGELLNIALNAMATKPADRFPDVKSFQEAIRSYRSHSESIAISSTAAEHLDEALRTSHYDSFSRARHGYEQAISLWSENQAAIDGLARCRIEHAKAALGSEDYDLGLSLLDEDCPEHQELIVELRERLRQRELRSTRLQLFRRLVAASLAVILIGGSVALYLINEQKLEADRQRGVAEQQTELAKNREREVQKQKRLVEIEAERAKQNAINEAEARKLAELKTREAQQNLETARRERMRAEKNEREAIAAKQLAVENAEKARRQEMLAKQQEALAKENELAARIAQQQAEYEAYLSQIGLAKARIDGNEFDDARRILTQLRSDAPGQSPAWEWRWLWEQTQQSLAARSLPAAVTDLAVDPSNRFAIVVCEDGSVHRLELKADGGFSAQTTWSKRMAGATSAVAGDRDQVAVGSVSGHVHLLDANQGDPRHEFHGHDDEVTDLAFLSAERLLTSSADRTVSLWDLTSRRELDRKWHLAAVKDLSHAVTGPNAEAVVLAAVSEANSGRVVGWSVADDRLSRLGQIKPHPAAVGAVAIDRDAKLAASADLRGQVAIWRIDDLSEVDYDDAIERAIQRLKTPEANETSATSGGGNDRFQQLAQFVSTPSDDVRDVAGQAGGPTWRAHDDAVTALQFDDSGEQLLTGSDDYSVRCWDVESRSLLRSFRGHGGWVRSLAVLPEQARNASPLVITGSADQTVRSWRMIAAQDSVPQQSAATVVSATSSETRIHDDEILAARLSPSGNRVITASRDRTARLLDYDPETRTLRQTAEFDLDEQASAEPSSGQLAEGTEFLAMSAGVDRVHRRLAVGNADSTIRLWDLETGVQLDALRGTGLNQSFALADNGRWLLSGSSRADAKALLWNIDPAAGKAVLSQRLGGHDQAVTAFAVSADGTRLATADRVGRCLIWNGETGEVDGQPLDVFSGDRINAIQFSADSQSLWVASDNGLLGQIDLGTRKLTRRLQHDGFVMDFDLSRSGDRIVTLSRLNTERSRRSRVRLWNLKRDTDQLLEELVAEVEGNSETSDRTRITDVQFADEVVSKTERLVISQRVQNEGGRFVGRVTVLELSAVDEEDDAESLGDSAPIVRRSTLEMPNKIAPPEVAIWASVNELITLNGDAAFRWDLQDRVHVKSYRAHAAVTGACFSPDGRLAWTASRSVRLWDAKSGQAVDKLENPHDGLVTGLDVSSRLLSDGSYLFATCGEDGLARWWRWRDRDGFQQLGESAATGRRVALVRFTPDGSRLLIARDDGSLQLMSVTEDSSDRIERWRVPDQHAVTSAAFSADGRWLAVGVADKTALLFDVTRAGTDPVSRMRGHADRIESVGVVQDKSKQLRVLTASRDKSFRIWDPRLAAERLSTEEIPQDIEPSVGREILSFRRHTRGLTAVDCNRQGDLTITAGRDGRLLLWPARFVEKELPIR
jgi:WD40 repeat protein/serine/threonine protein kinase